jgi:hypothetical protein
MVCCESDLVQLPTTLGRIIVSAFNLGIASSENEFMDIKNIRKDIVFSFILIVF